MTSQQLADQLLAQWQLLWPLPASERIKRIDEIRLDYEYERLLDDVALAVQEPETEVVQAEPSNLIQFAAIALFVGSCIGLCIIAATPVPA